MPAKEKIYTFGTNTDGLSEGLVKEFSVTGYTPISFFVDETVNNSNLYVGLRDNAGTPGSYKSYYMITRLNKTGTTDYVSTGFIEINPIL